MLSPEEIFKEKYYISPLNEIKALRKLIYETKKHNKDESCFTLELFGKIEPGKAARLKNKESISVYAAEIADNDSFTEYYYLDLEAIKDFDDTDNEITFRLLALGEIDPLEAPVLCSR